MAPGGWRSSLASLKTVRAVTLYFMAERITQIPVLWTWEHLIAYCRTSMGFEKVEGFRVGYLDHKKLLVAEEIY